MEWVLISIAIICFVLALIGSIVPALPGPPLAYVGMLLAHFSGFVHFSTYTLIAFALATVVIVILEFVVPAWGTKKFGGSKAGQWGSTIGVFVGLFFFPPVGLMLGAFLGAMIGELIADKSFDVAFRSGVGSFLGFIAGTFMKIIFCLVVIGVTVWNLF